MAYGTDRQGRFADTSGSNPILAGFQAASTDPVDKKFIRRQLKGYAKYGVPQKLSKFKGMTDTELERMAAKAIVLERGIKIDRHLRTKPNVQKYGRKRIKRAKQVMGRVRNEQHVPKKALKRTRDVRRHLKRIRANRRAMKLPLWRA